MYNEKVHSYEETFRNRNRNNTVNSCYSSVDVKSQYRCKEKDQCVKHYKIAVNKDNSKIKSVGQGLKSNRYQYLNRLLTKKMGKN